MKQRFCKKCGEKAPGKTLFCEACGTRLALTATAEVKDDAPPEEKHSVYAEPDLPENMPEASALAMSPGIRQDQHGTYRWLVEINLLKDSTIPLTVWKILLLCGLLPLVLMIILAIVEGNLTENLVSIFSLFGLVAAIMTALVAIGYYLVFIPIRGVRYPVVFEMDKKGISHIQMPKKQDNTELLAWLGILAGALAGNPTVVGANLLATSRKQLYTEFNKVLKIQVDRRKKIIKLIASDMTRNLIYSSQEDFEFVQEWILKHCCRDGVTVKYR
ncbi:hypothetical protein SOV_22210 [Sporomusa ovata DSM 2662]|uniref:Zinc-ribbon domain-containing protein n=1 Tax=Sporomusa ovata TaxID=2378 RepID=A0A0U1L335_9FIRM|nr:zinc ribbon domain-containing protein [Sporomusa ovata]EQB25538.1 hypothetical protein SOV_4c02000 [Sporomusa ovata DSM 2662]CQR74102.1 hypothetical protein SpAn4DRAFT_0564 [Sporomusa ovata]